MISEADVSLMRDVETAPVPMFSCTGSDRDAPDDTVSVSSFCRAPRWPGVADPSVASDGEVTSG